MLSYYGHSVVTWINKEGAAWLQAVGTLVAIAAAFVAYRQFKVSSVDLRVEAYRERWRFRGTRSWAWVLVEVRNRGSAGTTVNSVKVGNGRRKGLGLFTEWKSTAYLEKNASDLPRPLAGNAGFVVLLQPADRSSKSFARGRRPRAEVALANGKVTLVRPTRWPRVGHFKIDAYVPPPPSEAKA
jgi:hypothetical protein